MKYGKIFLLRQEESQIMNCANCDNECTSKKPDFLCWRCRKIEDIIEANKFPESDKLAEIHHSQAGRHITQFLSWVSASGYEICHDRVDYAWTPVHEYDTTEKFLRDYAGIDEEELEIELDALYQKLQRDNATK